MEIIADSAAAAAKEADAKKSTEVKEGDKDGDGENESGQEQKEEEQANVSGRMKNREKSQITRIQNVSHEVLRWKIIIKIHCFSFISKFTPRLWFEK